MGTSSRPIPGLNDRVNSLSESLSYTTPLAQASVARDIDEASDDDDQTTDSEATGPDIAPLRHTVSSPGSPPDHLLAGSDTRPYFTGAGNRATIFPTLLRKSSKISEVGRQEALKEERSLLRDNNIIPPKHPQEPQRRASLVSSHLLIPSFIPGGSKQVYHDEEVAEPLPDAVVPSPTEESPLLGDASQPYGGHDDPISINAKWEAAVTAGRIHTTWQREVKTLTKYSAPLVLTFLLQYSLTVASVFTVGHIGTAELGAVSLASMTANITGYAIYQGLATSLDTLCAQAYGSGHKKLVGLQMQRMIYFLWAVSIPIAIIWILAEDFLGALVPEQEVAALAGLYLRVVLIGAPGYAAFEAGKRFVQAQGLFSASLYVLLFCAPLNALMNWLLVWKFQMGFIGAPIAVAITDNLLPVGLFLYVRFFSRQGMSCWNGFTRKAFQNWVPMIKLALPGLLMVEAEVLAFEVLTLAAARFGATALAAQSVITTVASLAFQIPFPLSIAASTRVANLIGATLAPAARTSATVAGFAACFVGLFNLILLSSLRNLIPHLFTSNQDVIRIVSAILPLCAAFQLFDALAAMCNGILRGLGRQEVGGYVQVFCYYVVAMPISFGTAFGLGWGLWGLWTGVAIALGLIAAIEALFLKRTSFQRSVELAIARNEAG